MCGELCVLKRGSHLRRCDFHSQAGTPQRAATRLLGSSSYRSSVLKEVDSVDYCFLKDTVIVSRFPKGRSLRLRSPVYELGSEFPIPADSIFVIWASMGQFVLNRELR
jgi:hypothetical protein